MRGGPGLALDTGVPLAKAFGARPLKRAIRRSIQDPVALKMLDGEILPGDTVRVDGDLKKGEMVLKKEGARAVRA